MRRAALALALLVAGCGGAKREDAAGNAIANPASVPTVTVPADRNRRLAAAVRAAFPKGRLVSFGDEIEHRYYQHRLVDGPAGPVLVSAGEVPDASHAESAALAVHYLEPDGSRFRVKPGSPRLYFSGSFGGFSNWAISDRFLDVPVVYLEGGGTWQGLSCSRASLIALQPNASAEVASFQTYYSNSGDIADDWGPGAKSVEGKIREIAKGRGFTIGYSGSRIFEERYRLRNGKFELEGGKTQVPEC